jgi:SAM-dependent methyltransferase
MVSAFFYFTLLLVLIFSLVALIFSLSVVFGLIIARGVPFISLPRKDWVKMCEIAGIKPGQIVYDLGCGKANLLTTAAKKFGAKGVGYEISLWPYSWGRFNVWRQRADVELRFKNFFSADIKNADAVFCYLFPNVMVELESKFQQEMKPGAKVVSYAFYLPNIKPAQVLDAHQRKSIFTGKPVYTSKIYVYQF